MWVMGEQDIPFARGTGWQATELRYRGAFDPETGYAKPLAMTLILPDDLAAFEKTLTGAQLERIASSLQSQREHLDEVTYEVTRGAGAHPDVRQLRVCRRSLHAALRDRDEGPACGRAEGDGHGDRLRPRTR